MSESKLFDFMNVDLPEPKRSNVPWRFANRFTASPGYINVSAVIEVLPTDRWTGNIHSILRSRPTISSVYGSFRESHQAFFVPARLYSRVLDQLQTFGGTDFDPNADIPFPKIGWDYRSGELVNGYDGINLPCSLLSQLRMFPQMFSATNVNLQYDSAWSEGIPLKDLTFNAIPYVGYYDILRNYYFNDQELEMPFSISEFRVNGSNYIVDYALIKRSDLDDFISEVYYGSDSPDYYVSSVPGLYLFSQFSDNESVPSSFSSLVGVYDFTIDDTYCSNHLGLGVRTYDDDYFTVSLNNEYVDELNNSARVVVTNGSFAVSQMQRANRLHKHVSRNILRGSDYEDYLYVHFNAKLGREFNKPVFLGSVSNDFYFEDIYSTQVTANDGTQLNNNSLGTRAGVLNSSFKSNDGFIDFTSNEYGYIMVLSSIIPKVSYQNNTPRMYLKTGTADLYSPEFDAWSFQDVYDCEFNTISIPEQQIIEQYYEVAKSQPAWFEHLAPYDYAGGLYATDLEYGFQVLTRSNLENITSSYIRPWEWNYIFQFQAPWFDNFEWQILFDFNAYRPISKQILPSM